MTTGKALLRWIPILVAVAVGKKTKGTPFRYLVSIQTGAEGRC